MISIGVGLFVGHIVMAAILRDFTITPVIAIVSVVLIAAGLLT